MIAADPSSRPKPASRGRQRAHSRQRVAISRIFRAAAAAAGVYLAAVSGVWTWMRFGREMTDARFSHLLLPSRWALHRQALGDHYIRLGERQLLGGDLTAAHHSLRTGLARSPANFRGRLLLARLLASHGHAAAAATTLARGLPSADPNDLPAAFALLFALGRPDLILSHAPALLAQPAQVESSRPIVALAAARAAHLLGNYDQAARLLTETGTGRLPDGRLLAARIHWDQGYRELALVEIRALASENPSPAEAHRLLRDWLRATGATSEFRRVLLLARLAHPEQADIRLEWLSLLRAGRSPHLAPETDAFLQDFAHDGPALLALSEHAAQHGDSALARRIGQLHRSAGTDSATTAFLQAEAHLVAGEYAPALDLLRTVFPRPAQLPPRQQAIDDSLRAIAYFGLGDTLAGELHLRRFLSAPQLTASHLRAVATQLHRLDQSGHARTLLERAAAAEPRPAAAP